MRASAAPGMAGLDTRRETNVGRRILMKGFRTDQNTITGVWNLGERGRNSTRPESGSACRLDWKQVHPPPLFFYNSVQGSVRAFSE